MENPMQLSMSMFLFSIKRKWFCKYEGCSSNIVHFCSRSLAISSIRHCCVQLGNIFFNRDEVSQLLWSWSMRWLATFLFGQDSFGMSSRHSPYPIFVAKLAGNTNQYKQTIICLIVIDLLKSNRRRRHKKCFQTFLFLSKFLFTQRELSESYITVDYLGLSLLIQQWQKLDPVCSTVRYEMMKLCTGSI